MPRKRLEWSPRSRLNIEAIRDYIAADNPKAAISVIAEIIRNAEKLTYNPLIGHTGRRSGTRELVIQRFPYIIVYRVMPNRVIVAAVFHQSQQN